MARANSFLRATLAELVRIAVLLPCTLGFGYAGLVTLFEIPDVDRAVPALAFGVIVTSVAGLFVGGLPDVHSDERAARLAVHLLLTGVGIGLWFASGSERVVGIGLMFAVGLNALLGHFVKVTKQPASPSPSSY